MKNLMIALMAGALFGSFIYVNTLKHQLKISVQQTEEALAQSNKLKEQFDKAMQQVDEANSLSERAANVAEKWRDAAKKEREDLDLCKQWVEDMAIDLLMEREKQKIKI
jgi:LPS O-antigen subunit length determinant protein (WzzB/FepE family)